MKVIFLQDLPNVAYSGEVKEVADGYARNFLIPKQIAMIAKPGAINIVAARQAKMVTAYTELASRVEGLEINFKARAGAKDRLFGAITAADIANQLNEATGVDIDKRKIELDRPIHELGNYEIAIRLAREIVPKIRVTVSIEESTEEAKEESKKETPEEAEVENKEAREGNE